MIGSYVPSAVEASLFGIEIKGYTPDEAILIEKEEATVSLTFAQDGSATANLSKSSPYRVSISLQSTSATNTWFHLIYKLYERYGVDFKMPLYITDKNGDTSFFATEVFFENIPSVNKNKEVATHIWTFLCVNPSFTIGSNVDPDQIVQTLHMLYSALRVADMFGVDLSSFKSSIQDFSSSAVTKLKEMF